VIALVGSMGLQDEALRFAKSVYLDPWVASSCSLDCMAMIQATAGECTPAQFLRDALAQLDEPPAPESSAAITGTGRRRLDERQLVERLRRCLRGRKFLLVLHDVPNFFHRHGIKSNLIIPKLYVAALVI